MENTTENCGETAAEAVAETKPVSDNPGVSSFGLFIRGLLAVAVVLTITYGIAVTMSRGMNAGTKHAVRVGPVTKIPPSEAGLVVYNFKAGKSSLESERIETYLRALINYEYPDGSVLYVPVSLDDPENAHYVSDFELKGPGVVMMNPHRFEKFEKVRGYIRNEAHFAEYISSGMKRMLSDR